jgi:pyruvate/2-oxoglutarate dehydrogenase complex dihydrolipoamide dehydrogenase (E3) component
MTDMNMATNVKGIYAAGDVRHQLTKQITTAVGDGTTAVVAVTKLLEERENGRAETMPEEKEKAAVEPHQVEV